MRTNWIPDENRFHLAGPPSWFLDRLWDFDPSLVIVPSRQSFCYRLAQRRRLQLADHITQDALWNQSDTKMLARYSLVPVTTIVATANWSNPYIFEELRRRAPWRMGGADAVNQMLDDQDTKDDLDQRAQTNEHITALSHDAWNLYRKKIGTRSHMWSPTVRTTRKPSGNPAPGIIIAP